MITRINVLSRRAFMRMSALWHFLIRAVVSIATLVGIGCLSTAPVSTYGAESESVSISINWTQEYQIMDGFGASGAFQRATQLMEMSEPARTEILDALFSRQTGAGLSMVRNIVGDGSPLPDGVPTTQPSKGDWQGSGDEGQLWLMHEASRRGATRFMSTVWSAPAWMKDNQSVIGGSLSPDHYQDFADYLVAYIRGYEEVFNLDIYAISIANEPVNNAKYSSSLWSGEQIRDFIKMHLAPTFERQGLSTKIIIGEDETWSEELALATLADEEAAKSVDIVAAHGYLGDIHAFTRAKECGKTVWQTEVAAFVDNDPGIDDGIEWATKVHTYVVDCDASAFLYWWFVSKRNNRGALVVIDESNSTDYTLNKRLFTIGNFARFIRPGYIRIDCTANPAPDVYVSAYKDEDSGTLVIVAVNASKEPITLNIEPTEFQATAFTPYVTNATRDLREGDPMQPDKVSLAARSVTTLVGTADL